MALRQMNWHRSLMGFIFQPGAKAVVSANGHGPGNVIRRLEARGNGYVSFHGGIASDKRLN